MKRAFYCITICVILLFSLNGVEASNKIRISACFYPLAHFAEKVGGRLYRGSKYRTKKYYTNV